MKIQGQYPNIPVPDKNLTKTDQKETVDQKKVSNQETSSLESRKNFATHRIRQKLEMHSDVDMAKVNQIKKQIQEGKYQVDAEQVADKMLKDSFIEDI